MTDTNTIEYKVLAKSNIAVKELQDCFERYSLGSKNPFSNIICQVQGGAYISAGTPPNTRGPSGINIAARHFSSPINEFYTLLEDVRKQGVVVHYAERQYPVLPLRQVRVSISKPGLASGSRLRSPAGISLEGMGLPDPEPGEIDPLDDDDVESDVGSLVSNRIEYLNGDDIRKTYDLKQLEEFEKVTHSALWLDFDVIQRESEHKIDNAFFHSLIQSISMIIRDTINLDGVRNDEGVVERHAGQTKLHMYVVVLRKPSIVPSDKHPGCYKDSFHLRFLTTLLTKETKQYIRREILRRGFLTDLFSGITLVEDMETVVDPNSLTNTAMCLGSAKKGSKVAHEIHQLYKVVVRQNDNLPDVRADKAFDPIPDEVTEDKPKRGKAAAKPTRKRYHYNLCYELSLIHEAPNGLIKKRNFDHLPKLAGEIRAYAEQKTHNLQSDRDLANNDNQVQLLCERKPEARQVWEILKILKAERLRDYKSWRDFIFILAYEDLEYRPLAIWASQRCPESWSRNGLAELDKLWRYVADNPTKRDSPYGQDDAPTDIKSTRRTVATLYHWAKIDNPEAFREIQATSAFMQLLNISLETGQPNETEVCKILKLMYGTRLVTDKQLGAAGARRVWYAFNGGENGRAPGDYSLYKWRNEENICDSLEDIIANEFPKFVSKVIAWIESKSNDTSLSEETLKWYKLVILNLRKWSRKLGDNGTITKYVKTAGRVFREDGFIRKLDICEHVVGVGNGVLNLGEVSGAKTELIQSYNKFYITRSCTADWIPYDLSNPWIDTITMKVRQLFAGQEDAYVFTMCFLASTFDKRRKSPIFYIWLGEGANGKSFLLEFHIKVLGDCTREGYGFKMNASYFTTPDKAGGGPNTEKMQLKYANFAYCSETKPGDQLQTNKIKEFTGGESISGNEKFQKQENFDVNARFVMCSNYDPGVEGNDYGIWRRIRVYRFKMCFKDRPDPSNPLEAKIDPTMVEVWPKDSRWKQAYLSFMIHWYERYRDEFHFKLGEIPQKTIIEETREYQLKQDLASRFIEQTLEFVGDSYEQPDDTGKLVEQKTPHLTTQEISQAYIQWHKLRVNQRPPEATEVERQLKMVPQIKKHIERMGFMELVKGYILHPVGKLWTRRKPNLDPMHGLVVEKPGIVSLDLKQDEIAFQGVASQYSDIVRATLEEAPAEPVELVEEDIPDLDEDVMARDDEPENLKKAFPEFNSEADNKRLGLTASGSAIKIKKAAASKPRAKAV